MEDTSPFIAVRYIVPSASISGDWIGLNQGTVTEKIDHNEEWC